jgi:hypothetical protein
MKYLRDSFAYADRVLATINAKNALAPVSGPYGGPSTKLGVAVLAVWHASDHYGADGRVPAPERHHPARQPPAISHPLSA